MNQELVSCSRLCSFMIHPSKIFVEFKKADELDSKDFKVILKTIIWKVKCT